MTSAEYYEGIWRTPRDDMKRYGPFSRHYRRIIFDVLHSLQFDTAVDVGCGQGSFLSELKASFPRTDCCGIDISASALELAREKVPGAEFWRLDITRQYLDRKFDLVICSEVLEHLEEDARALQNIAQMTGGHLVISTVQGRMRRFEKHIGHVRNYAHGEILGKVEDAGLRVNRVIEWGFPFYSPLYRDLLDLVGGRGTTGNFGAGRRALSAVVYFLFYLNSSRRGDEIFVIAEQPARA